MKDREVGRMRERRKKVGTGKIRTACEKGKEQIRMDRGTMY